LPFQSVPDCASATFTFVASGVEVVNRLTFARPGGYDQSAIDDLAAACDGAVASDWLNQINNATTYLGVTVKGLADIIDLFAFNNDNAGVGAATGNQQPNNVTWAIRFTTGATGRSARGRMFVIGLPANRIDVATQSILTTYANNWVDTVVNTEAAAAAAGWFHCIVSRFTEGAERDTGVYRLVTGVGYHDQLLDSQRGRLP